MSSASLAKSSTIVPSFPGSVRLIRESVCTAFTPPEFFVDVHRVQQRLVETSLEFVRTYQESDIPIV